VGLKKWVIRKKTKAITVEGRMFDGASGEVILYFTHKKSTTEKKVTLEELAISLGQEIGKFLLSAAQ